MKDRHRKTGVIDIRIAGHEHHIDRVPPAGLPFPRPWSEQTEPHDAHSRAAVRAVRGAASMWTKLALREYSGN